MDNSRLLFSTPVRILTKSIPWSKTSARELSKRYPWSKKNAGDLQKGNPYHEVSKLHRKKITLLVTRRAPEGPQSPL